ncbi:Protein N-acetyltransferase, RimJ/RimL family [Catalinimonas alkaloidigena]|uniref:Protein N-acetyltransferase, RimJ/RimL family n=1 Tax=Catalinimonas alkaloidigena TaxID=1075417 RepID=A0A1G9RNU2_9BACT|nr:GNAT family N-acetyltransferase [Catalinimonas alkaloidigena]SDM24854.1 Protein N-acetyltransferase, RimJ/RimL family [Catalinimonas alkaloidigena]
MTRLETDRLVLTELTLADAPFMLHLLNTPAWLQYIGDRGVRTVDQAETYLLKGALRSYETSGFGFYRTALKTDDTPIGICGLVKRDFLDDVDIGFAFLPAYVGQGYGFEAAQATLTYATQTLGFRRLVGIVSEQNQPSVRLLQKLGFRYERHMRVPGEDKEVLLLGQTW